MCLALDILHLAISLNFLPLLKTFTGLALVQYLGFQSQH